LTAGSKAGGGLVIAWIDIGRLHTSDTGEMRIGGVAGQIQRAAATS
jgi:hypothetical protein